MKYFFKDIWESYNIDKLIIEGSYIYCKIKKEYYRLK